MRKLIGIVPVVMAMGAGCGSRGDSTEPSDPIGPIPVTECESDADCDDDAICYFGECLATAPTTPTSHTGATDPGAQPTTTTSSSTGEAPYEGPDVGGVWYGYIEAYDRGLSDLVRLEINTADCTPTAKVILGEDAAPAPATDGSVGYPQGGQPGALSAGGGFADGFEYTAVDLQITDRRIELFVESGELWGGWCALQTSYTWGETYGCVPNWGYSMYDGVCSQTSPEGETTERDCGQLELCTGGAVCECSESGCEAGVASRASLDVAIEDDHLEGVLSGFGTVRFYRE